MKNLKKPNLEAFKLNDDELGKITGGDVSWSDIWGHAYDGNWHGAITGVQDKIEDFFD